MCYSIAIMEQIGLECFNLIFVDFFFIFSTEMIFLPSLGSGRAFTHYINTYLTPNPSCTEGQLSIW